MDGGGSFTGSDEPDDTDDAPLRGWISPDDRLWRHPSELVAGSDSPAASTVREREDDRRMAIAVGSVGAAAVVVVVLAAFALTGSATVSATHPVTITVTSAATTVSVGGPDTPSKDDIAMVSALRRSIVEVIPTDPSATSVANIPTVFTGVVLPGGRLVVTAASAVVGLRSVEIVTSDGTDHTGTVIGSDDRSGVAVVAVNETLASAAFSDDEVRIGTAAVAACLCGDAVRSAGPAAPDVSVGVVSQAGQSATLTDGTDLIDTIEVAVPRSLGSWGTVLLDRHGVEGILDAEEQVEGETLGVFVPSALAENVADELAQGHDLDHGWLGILCADPGPTAASDGPLVTGIFADSPAGAAGIEAGDEIRAVDGRQVATVAELQASLYTAEPGTTVELTTVRGSSVRQVSVTLASEPD